MNIIEDRTDSNILCKHRKCHYLDRWPGIEAFIRSLVKSEIGEGRLLSSQGTWTPGEAPATKALWPVPITILSRDKGLMILEIFIFSFKNRLNIHFYPRKYGRIFVGGPTLNLYDTNNPKKSERSENKQIWSKRFGILRSNSLETQFVLVTYTSLIGQSTSSQIQIY